MHERQASEHPPAPSAGTAAAPPAATARSFATERSITGGTAVAVRAPEASVVRIDFTVADLEASVRFFVNALGARRGETHRITSSPDLVALLGFPRPAMRITTLALGGETIALRRLDGRRGRAVAQGATSRDLEFQHIAIVVRDIDVAWQRVIAADARPISPEPQRIPESNPDAGGIRAAYFRDAEGHPLELIWYPPGRGDPRWQQTTGDALVLGIDHTAIAASSSEASRRFYVDSIGMQVGGTSLNSGTEQERLSGVEGARVAITGMRGASGPGVELLEYREPGPGRARGEARISDLVHVETAIAVHDLDATVARLRAANSPMLSDAPQPCAICAAPAVRAIVVRDPDGHAVRLEGR